MRGSKVPDRRRPSRSRLSRRQFLGRLAAAGSALGAAGLGVPLGVPLGVRRALAAARPPNLIYVFSDEHRDCAWPGGGNAQVVAPNLARLAGEGVVFTRCVSNFPLCSPHRATLLTGQYPPSHGVVENVTTFALDPARPTIAKALRDRGYATGYVGKWHLQAYGPGQTEAYQVPPGPYRYGFDDFWRATYDSHKRYASYTFDDAGAKVPLTGYGPAAETDLALNFLDANAGRPFCLFLSWQPPHPPYTEAPQEHVDRYAGRAIDFRPNVPEAQRTSQLADDHRGYYAHISALDEQLGRILDRLDALSLAGDTVVVFSSDHGDLLGSHGQLGKDRPWEEAVHVPFVVRWPGVVPSGFRTDALLSTADVAPTLLALLGAPVPAEMQGLDLSAAALGEPEAGPGSTLLMGTFPSQGTVWRGVRTGRHTYAAREVDGRLEPWLLYDDAEDPYQLVNRVAAPGSRALRDELEADLAAWLDGTGDAWVPAALGAAAEAEGPWPAGTAVTFTASGRPVTGRWEFRFWLRGPGTGGAWRLERAYAEDPGWVWQTRPEDAGVSRVKVQARRVGSAAVKEEEILLTGRVAPLVAVTASPSPSAVGAPVTFRAAVEPPDRAWECRFLLRGPATGGLWRVVREYAGDPDWVWTPAAGEVGAYKVKVRVREAGSGVAYDAETLLAHTVET